VAAAGVTGHARLRPLPLGRRDLAGGGRTVTVQMAEHQQLVGAETPVAALLSQPTVETHDATADAGGFGEVVHEKIVRDYLLSGCH
jgi:hypothetical protein